MLAVVTCTPPAFCAGGALGVAVAATAIVATGGATLLLARVTAGAGVLLTVRFATPLVGA